MTEPVVVIGGGIAGSATAAALGEAGVQVVLLDAGTRDPYDRPPLSKRVVVGRASADDVTLHPLEWWSDNHVDLRTRTRVTSIDGHTVQTEDGTAITASSIVLATGGRPRRLQVPGSELAGVFVVHDLDGALACASALVATDDPIESVVIVGAGFVGCEAAAAIHATGTAVTVLEACPHPLVHAVGPRIAQFLLDLHHRNGVEMHTNIGVVAFEGDTKVRGVRTADGTVHPADLVIVAVGIELHLDLARALGAVCGTGKAAGVEVDDSMRTSVDGVLAVGDIARYPSRFAGVSPEGTPESYRCEHYNVALGHGAAAARTILGDPTPYDELPTYWTDQFGLTINASGPTELADDVVVRGSLDDHDFLAAYFRSGTMIAGLACGQHRELRSLGRLLQRGVPVRRDQVANAATTFQQLDRDSAHA